MSFDMTNIKTETGSNGHTDALFEGLAVPADSAAVLKRSTPRGAPRVQSAVRNQVELRACNLDSSLPGDHQARAVWAFVQSLDLQALYGQIQAVEGGVRRAPIDPAILMSLSLCATLDGVGSARELDRLCESDDAYRWVCAGVGVNHHTLGDFQSPRLSPDEHRLQPIEASQLDRIEYPRRLGQHQKRNPAALDHRPICRKRLPGVIAGQQAHQHIGLEGQHGGVACGGGYLA